MNEQGLCEQLEWDSRFFGVSIARAVPSRADAETVAGMLDWCRARRVECFYFLADADDPDTVAQLEAASFERVDERVTLERELNPATTPTAPDTRSARPGDIPALREIAAVSHRDSRFYNDGRFERDRCDEFYRVWIENSCRGWADHVVVAEREGVAIGYLTVHLRGPDTASLGLMGVEPALRRHGIGGVLLQGALAWIAGQSISHVWLATQGRNSASQGFFQNAGFRPVSRAFWYHHWLVRPADVTR